MKSSKGCNMTKKDEIIETAKSVFRQYGLNKVTLEDVASRLGMKKNSLYYYFKNKNDLVIEVFKSEFSDFINGQLQIIQYNEPLKEKLVRFLSYRVTEAYKFLTDYNVLSNTETTKFHDTLHRESEKLLLAELNVINLLLEHYNINERDKETLSTIILSICQGFVYKMYLYNLSQEKIADDIVATVNMLFSGISLSQ